MFSLYHRQAMLAEEQICCYPGNLVKVSRKGMDIFACVTFVFAFVDTSFAFSAYQRFHVPKWADNTMVS